MVNVLSIHLGHHGSISISKGNELIVHTEISRYNKFKYASWPAYSLIKKINELNLIFDVVILNRMQNDSLPQWKNIFQRRLISVSKNCNFIECDDHHDFHQSCSALFNNSKNTIVWDSSGKKFVHSNIVSYENFSLYENNNLKYKECWTPEKLTMQHKNINISNNNVSLADAYSCFCNELGLLEKDPFSEGKAMAFSQFGVNKKNILFALQITLKINMCILVVVIT
jgi:hypothetical protein